MVTVDEDDQVASQHSKIIVDGGYLLHRVSWKGQTYEEIIKCHLSYVKSKYGTATIAFDGYGQVSTKDHEHARQTAEQLQVFMFLPLIKGWSIIRVKNFWLMARAKTTN